MNEKIEMEDKIINRLDQLNKKIELEQDNGLRTKNDTKTRHPAETSLIGLSLISFGMLLDNGAFTGLFIVGFLASLIDLPGILGNNESKWSKLLSSNTFYFVAGGISASIVLYGTGHTMPQPELGLLADITFGILNLGIQLVTMLPL